MLRNLADDLEWMVHEALIERGRIGEAISLPWGERVTLLPDGERAHEFPLTQAEARILRVFRAHGVFAGIIAWIRG